MTRTARSADRPRPVFRACDGAPWPTENELDLDAEWAAFRESAHKRHGTAALASTDSPFTADGRLDHERANEHDALDDAALWHPDDCANPLSEAVASVVDLDARLGHLECVVRDRRRATADEYRLILAILDDAAFDPTPWVGPDPTVDCARQDPRGRTPRAVRRDRIDLAERAAVAEIAVRLHLSEQTVRTRAAHARTLAEGCPRLWAAFGDGRLSEKHAVDAARLASTLPAGDNETFDRFDEEACPSALVLPPATFAVAARAIRERVHAESIESRHRRAAQDRGVWMTAELDGMASLHALLPGDRARAVMSRLDRAARHLRAAPDESRTLAQLRADAFADLVTMTESPPAEPSAAHPPPETDGCHAPPPFDAPRTFRSAPPATVVVTIPALTLLGRGTEPAVLEGYGPIDLDTARRLAGSATSWIRLLTHPVNGAPLVLDRKAYRVPTALRRWLGVTSPTCVFPGCGRAARECDIDHRTAWADGGTTDDDNLDPKCRHHHRLRHESRWDIDHPPGEDTVWVSPLGGRYGTDPPPF
ncbi:hypothetical protein QE410_001345 [Microbacterium sp. SORGH_AS 1204]|uniref:HNH endonuclease signature motif containing protein n=1 Tax=Microbacterium sp. SORGH_AS_1204 TaxID=3041785 RepID=UPI00278FC3EA|nr:HNH endonuclease signature motif containing protein [Microbacterium sp. SORGH_AS_1204]MDQ1136546.1 hypothetical protein [Microbacterium sp. SORGH_AS_1204]